MARIVVVEDDELVAELVTETLAGAGHMVSAVHHGDEALGAVIDGAPDLVLLDYSLPGRTGLEVLRDIRRLRAASEMPVMMLTGRNGLIMRGRAASEGADDYVTKPFAPDDLLARVEKLLLGSRVCRGLAQPG